MIGIVGIIGTVYIRGFYKVIGGIDEKSKITRTLESTKEVLAEKNDYFDEISIRAARTQLVKNTADAAVIASKEAQAASRRSAVKVLGRYKEIDE
ncbi:MAG: hypothetical protein HOI47_12595, partial [Candidatus Scalindua sp.]|nr:hypothetical protein [Candidatus Scalindua sp.]